jgi:hypothetical protein
MCSDVFACHGSQGKKKSIPLGQFAWYLMQDSLFSRFSLNPLREKNWHLSIPTFHNKIQGCCWPVTVHHAKIRARLPHTALVTEDVL